MSDAGVVYHTGNKNGDAILKITEKKNAVYTWDPMNEKITSPAKK